MRKKRRLLSFLTMLLVSLSYSLKTNAQYELNLNIDVDKLADAAWAPVFKSMVENHLYYKEYKDVYRACYREIYQKQRGQPAPIAYFYMGSCLEMGMGTSEVSQHKAKAHYEKGASLGDRLCKERLNSINSKGYWGASSSNRDAFARMYGRFMEAKPESRSYSQPNPNKNDGVSCGGCHGSGKCTYCGGSGRVVVDAGTYVAYDCYVYKNCPVCNGSGNCGTCRGRGKL